MASPRVDNNFFTERSGVLQVAKIVNDMRCVWRETPNKDVGIDGQIEYVNDAGEATGHVVAVQVKSGSAYVKLKDNYIRFQPDEKHRLYWENFPLPVIVVIYDPATGKAYWEDARRWLRTPPVVRSDALRLPLKQTLDLQHKASLFETCGALEMSILPIPDVLRVMIEARNHNAGFDLTFFDLFASGLTDICRKLFFSVGLCMEIAEYKLALTKSEFGVGVGYNEYEFIDRYVRFLVSQNLVFLDFSDYLIDLREREMTSTFICALTSRGQQLVDHIHTVKNGIRQGGYPYLATERPVTMAGDYHPLQKSHLQREINGFANEYLGMANVIP